jgi:hypothetical protein
MPTHVYLMNKTCFRKDLTPTSTLSSFLKKHKSDQIIHLSQPKKYAKTGQKKNPSHSKPII